MSALSEQLARLVAGGVAAVLTLLAPPPDPVATPLPGVPVVRTAAERPESGGERVRRIAAPPRRAADAGSGSGSARDRTLLPDERSAGSVRIDPDRADPDRADPDRADRPDRADARPGSPSAPARPRGSRSAGGGGGGGGGGGAATGAPTAAAAHGWGTPTREDDFSAGVGDWGVYDGSGHDGNGRRSPDAISVQDGVLTITGTPDGTTGGLAWNPGRKYGRWEARVRSPAGDPDYHSVLLLWPDAEDWPSGGEVDFMEISDASRQNVEMFLHYGADNSQVQGDLDIDATEWHTWAVEWTPDHIAAFVDGEEWWRTDDTGILPPGPMHLTIQLDNFGAPRQETAMHVDWVREYDV